MLFAKLAHKCELQCRLTYSIHPGADAGWALCVAWKHFLKNKVLKHVSTDNVPEMEACFSICVCGTILGITFI